MVADVGISKSRRFAWISALQSIVRPIKNLSDIKILLFVLFDLDDYLTQFKKNRKKGKCPFDSLSPLRAEVHKEWLFEMSIIEGKNDTSSTVEQFGDREHKWSLILPKHFSFLHSSVDLVFDVTVKCSWWLFLMVTIA